VRVEVTPARPEEVPLLRRLMQLYLYDLAAIDGWEVADDGTYGSAEQIERFWTGADRHAFVARVDGRVAGFALVRRGAQVTSDPDTHEISEFFVLRRHRRRAVGEQVARQVFDRFPGRWEVMEMASNADAQAFWRAVIGRYTGGHFEDFDWQRGRLAYRVQRFEAGHR
jgi:predicted acetyltransferase